MLRIITALLFMQNGLMKIFHFPTPHPEVSDPLPMIIQTAGWIEVVGGGLLALGLFSRITAFVTSGEMAFAYFIGHAPTVFGRRITAMPRFSCASYFFIASAGPGPWSVDHFRRVWADHLHSGDG